jgi:hypothetical protein
MFLNLIPPQYKAFAIAIAIAAYTAAVAIGSWHTGAKLARSDCQAEKIALQQAQQKALLDQVAKNDAILKDQQAKARKASDDHEKALSDLQAKYDAAIAANRAAGGLRVPRTVCDQPAASAQTSSASRPDEASPGTVELPQRIEDDLFALTKRADELAEQLRALQQWIKDNGLAT